MLAGLISPTHFLLIMMVASVRALQQITFSVQEELPQGRIVGNLLTKISGSSSTQVYSIIPNKSDRNSGSSYFDIDAKGNVKIKKRIDRDSLEHCHRIYDCYLTFQVFPLGNGMSHLLDTTVTVRVNIGDLNDNFPKWKNALTVRLNEDFAVGKTFTVEPAVDEDYGLNGTLNYRLEDDTNTFTVQSSKPYAMDFSKIEPLYIVVNKPLDRESIEQYNLTLHAVDSGSVPRSGSVKLTVFVEDLNDHPPKFDKSSYRVSIRETTSLRTPVITFRASDPDRGLNGEVEYVFSQSTSVSVRKYFRLDSRLGVLSLGQPLDYDVAKTREFDFTVIARDRATSPLSASAQVYISVTDVNDCDPSFSVYQIMKTGMKETTKLEVLENIEPLSVLGIATVVDYDSGAAGEVDCQIQGQANNIFKLLPHADKVSAQKTYSILNRERFDREAQATYVVSVLCRDHGTPARSRAFNLYVHIRDVNDMKPVFTQRKYIFSVKENMRPSTRVGSVRANDRDSGENARVSYSISPESEDSQLFRVLPHGDILTQKELDRESKSLLNLVVIARDHGNPSLNASVPVEIRVEDDNDCSPRFEHSSYTFEIFENEPPDTVVGNLTAFDEDAGSNAYLSFTIDLINSRQPVPFQVGSPLDNGLSGLAQIRTTGIIDRENSHLRNSADNAYVFNVRATDRGMKSLTGSTMVTVYIRDRNDNKPMWIFPSNLHKVVNVSVHEDVGTSFATLRTTDGDEGENGKVEYFIKDGDVDNVFALDPHTGDIQIRQPLKSAKTYHLVIVAKDRPGQENESQSSTEVLTVNVINRPKDSRGRHRGNPTLKTEDINEKIIIALISCTAVIALILVLVILAARCVLMRNTRSATKRSEKQRGEALGNHHEGLLFVPSQHGHFDGTLRRPEITSGGTLLASNDSGKGGSIDGLCDSAFAKKGSNSYQVSTLTNNLDKHWPPNQHYTTLAPLHTRIPEYYDVVRDDSSQCGEEDPSAGTTRAQGLAFSNSSHSAEEHNLLDRTRSQEAAKKAKHRYHPAFQASSFV